MSKILLSFFLEAIKKREMELTERESFVFFVWRLQYLSVNAVYETMGGRGLVCVVGGRLVNGPDLLRPLGWKTGLGLLLFSRNTFFVLSKKKKKPFFMKF